MQQCLIRTEQRGTTLPASNELPGEALTLHGRADHVGRYRERIYLRRFPTLRRRCAVFKSQTASVAAIHKKRRAANRPDAQTLENPPERLGGFVDTRPGKHVAVKPL